MQQQQGKGDPQKVIAFTEQNYNQKKKLQEFLIQNDINFVRNESGTYEAVIKLTTTDDQLDVNKENKGAYGKKSQQELPQKTYQNNMQSFLNDKINVSSYLNEQRQLSTSPSGSRLSRNQGENKNKTKVTQSKQSKTPSRQSYSKVETPSQQKPDIQFQAKAQKTSLPIAGNNTSKQKAKATRNYINTESSPFKTDFSTRWRLNRSRTPESPNIKQDIDVVYSPIIKNRPLSQQSSVRKSTLPFNNNNNNNNNNNSKQSSTDQDNIFKKSIFMDGVNPTQKTNNNNNNSNNNNITPNKSQMLSFGKENSKNKEQSPPSFDKNIKFQLQQSQMLKKSSIICQPQTQNTRRDSSPADVNGRSRVISLIKMDNSNNNNNNNQNNRKQSEFQINLYEDASDFKKRNQKANEGGSNNDNLVSNSKNSQRSILKNSSQDSFGMSTIIEERVPKQNQIKNNDPQSQLQHQPSNKTASFHNQDSSKTKQNSKSIQEFHTPSGKKKKGNTSYKIDKYPSSQEIMKNIQKQYLNPIKYPVVEDGHHYTPIQSNFSPKIRSQSKQLSSQLQKNQQSPERSQSPQPPIKAIQLSSIYKELNRSQIMMNKHQTKQTDNNNRQKEFTPEKRGKFAPKDFSPSPSYPNSMQQQIKNDKKRQEENSSPNNQSNRNSSRNQEMKQDVNTPIKSKALTKSDLSMNERAGESITKSTNKSGLIGSQKISQSALRSDNSVYLTSIKGDRKSMNGNNQKKQQKGRSSTPEHNKSLSQSDLSLNDRMSLFKQSRLSNMPDIKLKVKQNHNYSAVLTPNQNINGSRPSSSQMFYQQAQQQTKGLNNTQRMEEQSISTNTINSMFTNTKFNDTNIIINNNNNNNESTINNTIPNKSTDRSVSPFISDIDTDNQQKRRLSSQQKMQFKMMQKQSQQYLNKQMIQDHEIKQFSVDLNLDEENSPRDVYENEEDEQSKINKSAKRVKAKSNSKQRGSILLLNSNSDNGQYPQKFSKDSQFEQGYFSFNSQNNQFSPQKMLSSSFMNINKNDRWLDVFKEDDLRINGNNDNFEKSNQVHRYSRLENNSTQEHTSIQQTEDINVKQLGSNELVHYYQFILEKAKQNQHHILKGQSHKHH